MTNDGRHEPQSAWQAVGRPILSYLAAAGAAGAVIYLSGVWFNTFGKPVHDIPPAFMIIPVLSAIIAVLASVPAIISAAILRRTRWPHGVVETAAGALIGLVVSSAFLLAVGGEAVLTRSLPAPLLSYSLAGATAGLTYWLVLGRPRNPRAQ